MKLFPNDVNHNVTLPDHGITAECYNNTIEPKT